MPNIKYLDCNATTPIEPRVFEGIRVFLLEEYGNPGSRTHEFGIRAKQAIQNARQKVGNVVDADPAEVIFTSGATESNNLAILGLAAFGEKHSKKHIVSTQIEHKAILEPLEHLSSRGFEITLIPPTDGGWVDSSAVLDAVRPETLLVSVMHANNETGVIQPITEIADFLQDTDVFFHTDAAQGFGKDLAPLRNQRIDLISISGHKIYGPKGIGALIMRRRDYKMPPVLPLMFGGGQERGIRPGTAAVHLIVGLGIAAELALKEQKSRNESCLLFRKELLRFVDKIGGQVLGDQSRCLSHVLNIRFPNLDSEAIILALKEEVAISNGSACTSASYSPSHVLSAMCLPPDQIQQATRWSWCHLTKLPDWDRVNAALCRIM